MTPRDAESELSRLRVDGVTEILGVALGVLEDHAPDHGDTRLERLARFVLLNMRADVALQLNSNGSYVVLPFAEIDQWRDSIRLETRSMISLAEARNLATGLLLCADHADRL